MWNLSESAARKPARISIFKSVNATQDMRQLRRKRRTSAVSLGIIKIPIRICIIYGSGNAIWCRLAGKVSNADLRGTLSQQDRTPESHFRGTGHDGRMDSFFVFFSFSHFFLFFCTHFSLFLFFLCLILFVLLLRSISQTRTE